MVRISSVTRKATLLVAAVMLAFAPAEGQTISGYLVQTS
jgi:hypothetical protein